MRAGQFDWMGVFEYSDVDNAGSFALDGKVDAEVITERRNQLMAIQKKISREKLRAWKGRTEMALIEGPSKDNPLVWEARLQGMAPEIDGKVYLTDIELPDGRLADTGDAAQSRNHQDRRLRSDRSRRGNSAARGKTLAGAANHLRTKSCIALPLERHCAFWDKISAMKHRCPICKKATDSELDKDFPFCSERCRLTGSRRVGQRKVRGLGSDLRRKGIGRIRRRETERDESRMTPSTESPKGKAQPGGRDCDRAGRGLRAESSGNIRFAGGCAHGNGYRAVFSAAAAAYAICFPRND